MSFGPVSFGMGHDINEDKHLQMGRELGDGKSDTWCTYRFSFRIIFSVVHEHYCNAMQSFILVTYVALFATVPIISLLNIKMYMCIEKVWRNFAQKDSPYI
ncbi:unnamed protein product [Urochloa humidicola]